MVGCKSTNEFGIYYRIQPFHSLLVSSKPKGRQFLISLLRFFFLKEIEILVSLVHWLFGYLKPVWKSASSSVLAVALPDNLRGGPSMGRVRLGGDARSLLAAALERSHRVLLTASAVQPFFSWQKQTFCPSLPGLSSFWAQPGGWRLDHAEVILMEVMEPGVEA